MTLLSILNIRRLENVRHYEIMSFFRGLRAQGMKLFEHMVDQNEREVLVSVALQELSAKRRRKRKARALNCIGQVCRSGWLGTIGAGYDFIYMRQLIAVWDKEQ